MMTIIRALIAAALSIVGILVALYLVFTSSPSQALAVFVGAQIVGAAVLPDLG